MSQDQTTEEELSPRDLAMQFESLGGAGHGCEFGIFQRECGAEPLGLLRWADLAAEFLMAALETRFDGVGSEQHTEIFVPPTSNRPEYWTKDRRYWMAMRCFTYPEEIPYEKMVTQACRRLQFLRRKLIADLERGTKIFVFKIIKRNLTDEELERLCAAVRQYGEATLLYVRYADELHPNGTVKVVRPGLMVGYIDHFAFSPDDRKLGSATASWLTISKRAYTLRKVSDWRPGGVD